jgi:hypothetical protein
MHSTSGKDAAESLDLIASTQRRIESQGAQEYWPFIWWGLFILIGYPPFDYLKGNVWGLTLGVTWVVGMFLTIRYFKAKTSRVHTLGRQSIRASIAIGVITFVSIGFANILHPSFHYSWTIIGILLASLYFGYGLRLKSASK